MTLRNKPRKPIASPPRRKNAAAVVLRSEGQRLLIELDMSSADVARAATVTRQVASEWRAGTKSPGPKSRAALWHAYGIPAFTWGRVPNGGGAEIAADADPSPPPAPTSNGNGHAVAGLTEHAANAATPDTIRDTDALIARVRETAHGKDLLPSDLIRLADSESKLLALRHRMLREQDLLEDKIVRDHPAWQRIRRTLAEVLAKHPLAAAEVAEALQRLDLGNL